MNQLCLYSENWHTCMATIKEKILRIGLHVLGSFVVFAVVNWNHLQEPTTDPIRCEKQTQGTGGGSIGTCREDPEKYRIGFP